LFERVQSDFSSKIRFLENSPKSRSFKNIDDVTLEKEPVSFTCRPVTGTIGDLLKEIKDEDKGVDHAAVFAQVN